MRCFSKLIKQKSLYNLFLFLALLNIFFSTENSVAKTFSIKEIEISSPFNASFEKNIPICLALIGIWNSNFLNSETQAIIPYNESLCFLPNLANWFSEKP